MNGPEKPQELMMDVQATQRELLAVNLAISYFTRYCQTVSSAWPEAHDLLTSMQKRINERIAARIKSEDGFSIP